jgi:dTDP-4-amino-4,6-dideoxygalactose transaminase
MILIPHASPGLKVKARRHEIDQAIARVLASGRYILGSETEAFETEFGCVATRSEAVAARVRRARNYGFGEKRVCVEDGFNSRLHELQAAILRALLPYLDADNRAPGSLCSTL